jgi:hypothetical protein
MSKTAIVWSCAHADPAISNERFSWLGDLIEDIKPDYCIDLGDGADMRSLNSFDSRYPQAIVSQSYQADIESYNDSQSRIWDRYRVSKKKRPFRIGFEGNHCVPAGTEVLVETLGWVAIEDTLEGQRVMTLEGWQPIEAVISLDYDGGMINYGDRSVGSLTTEQHRVYYYNSKGGMVVKKAVDAPESLDLPVSTVVGKGLDYTYEQLRFIGVALTDSYFGKDGKSLWFYQSGGQADYIESIIKDAGVEYKRVARNRDITHIMGKELKSTQTSYEFKMKLPEWCVTSNKTIPDSFFSLSEQQFEVLLEVMIFCDGSIPTRATHSRVFYGRKEICDNLQALLVTKGYRATLTEYRPTHWRVNICKTKKCRAKKQHMGNYKGKVWCLTTPTHNFLMRQNNKPCFTGNCNRIKKAIAADPRIEGAKYGVSFKHLNTDQYFDEYHEYQDSAPAIVDYDGVSYAHYFSSGNYGTAMSGLHHAYSLLQLRNHSSTCGHSHKRGIYFKDDAHPKGIIGLVAGCYKGGREGWAGQANNGWAKGVVIKRNIDHGMYDFQWVSIEVLKKTYG